MDNTVSDATYAGKERWEMYTIFLSETLQENTSLGIYT
jgi:hypothetical protein